MTCAACLSNGLGRFQTGCDACYVRHTAILHPDERARRYGAIKAAQGHEAAAAFVGAVNRARQIFRERVSA